MIVSQPSESGSGDLSSALEGLGGGLLTGRLGCLVLSGESGDAEWLNGRGRRCPVGWKGDTTEVTGVSQVASLGEWRAS